MTSHQLFLRQLFIGKCETSDLNTNEIIQIGINRVFDDLHFSNREEIWINQLNQLLNDFESNNPDFFHNRFISLEEEIIVFPFVFSSKFLLNLKELHNNLYKLLRQPLKKKKKFVNLNSSNIRKTVPRVLASLPFKKSNSTQNKNNYNLLGEILSKRKMDSSTEIEANPVKAEKTQTGLILRKEKRAMKKRERKKKITDFNNVVKLPNSKCKLPVAISALLRGMSEKVANKKNTMYVIGMRKCRIKLSASRLNKVKHNLIPQYLFAAYGATGEMGEKISELVGIAKELSIPVWRYHIDLSPKLFRALKVKGQKMICMLVLSTNGVEAQKEVVDHFLRTLHAQGYDDIDFENFMILDQMEEDDDDDNYSDDHDEKEEKEENNDEADQKNNESIDDESKENAEIFWDKHIFDIENLDDDTSWAIDI
eukprot:TRINITY_DN1970_c0_g1_i1.p1 TRINITY_DN1970_c0_g1~~TRINITY_DN1970_c0_g1_i1.p1  ORF type:complete len:424 (+),score=125.27 TRINITY_DN1970_c0_g1_i1:94-1365(+)